MPQIAITKRTSPSNSTRAKQVSGMFDLPASTEQVKTWKIDAPYEEKDWSVGLIVGPSGSGKSSILNEHFGGEAEYDWGASSVLDDFSSSLSIEDITNVCSAVGFNTIPSWLRPHALLSNGEQFRIGLARALLESTPDQPIIIDEFTSVVDRQVAQIGSHAVQKWVRKKKRQLVVASCHYDIIDWLQPDWVIDASHCSFEWRRLQQRPELDISIRPVTYDAWNLFAPFHYLDASLNPAARCYVAFVDGRPASFVGIMPAPHPKRKNMWRISRWVTLPDWQGLGLAFVLANAVAGSYKHLGQGLKTTPAHPALIRACDRAPEWKMTKAPGFSALSGNKKKITLQVWNGKQGAKRTSTSQAAKTWAQGSRPSAVFEYVGPAWPEQKEAFDLLLAAHGSKSKLFS